MNDNRLKFAAGIIMFLSWVALVVYRVPNSEELIGFIKFALVGLGAHTAANPKVPT